MTSKNKQHMFLTFSAVLLGNALLALDVVAFVAPHGIIMGGATGIGLLLSKFIAADTATIVLVLNSLILLLGAVVLGKKFFITTVIGSLLYPALLAIMQKIPWLPGLTADPLLAALLGGALLGISVGLTMRVGSSTGGIDALVLVLNKWFHIPISVLVYLCDALILGGQALFSDPEQILYGMLFLVIETLVLNQVMLLGKTQLQLFVVSSKYAEIRKRILADLNAGATMMYIETGCTGLHQQGIMSVIPPKKLFAATQIIQSIDPEAFMTITQIKEVRGRGFTLERQDYELLYEQLQQAVSAENKVI